MQGKRHDRVVEMWLCFFSGKVDDYKVQFESTRKCRSTLKGHDSIRRGASSLKPGSIVMYKGEKMTVHGTHTRYVTDKEGKTVKKVNVQFTCPASDGRKSASMNKCTPVSRVYNTGWKRYWPDKK